MRIAIVADFNVMGGTRTYFELLSILLHDEGHELVGLIPKFDSVPNETCYFMKKYFKAWQTLPRRDGLLCTRQPFATFFELRHLLPFVLRYKPTTLVFSHGTPGSWLSTLLLPFPSVHVLHSCVLTYKQPERCLLPLFLKMLSSKKRLCTVSNFAGDLISKTWRASAAIIYNPAPQNCSMPAVERKGPTRIITMGHVVDYKNPYVWLSVAQRVLARHPEIRFIWYGEGPLLERMRNLSSGLLGISFPGRTATPQQVLSTADIYFHPSDLESHGIAVVEAMCHGLPCVVSRVGGLPESVSDGLNGFVLDPDDGPGMADALCRLVEDVDKRRAMGEAGKIIALEKFSFDDWANKTLSLINSVSRK